MGAERGVEPFLVAIERVRVLHDELAHPDQPAARPRLVALLRLEVVEDLRQVAIGAELPRVERDRLLVRHREHELAPTAVGDLEQLGNPVPAGLLPELGRRQDGHGHLLAADRVHLLADDLHDLLVDAPARREVRPEARHDLADQARADEELVGDRLGVRGVLAQGREEERRLPLHHRDNLDDSSCGSAVQPDEAADLRHVACARRLRG